MRTFILTILFLGLSGCDSSSQTLQLVESEAASVSDKVKQPEPVVTIKPGAAVLFTANFAGPLQVGEKATLIFQLTPQYESGRIDVEIKAQDGLSLEGRTRFSESFSGPYQFSSQLEVGADVAGEYTLSVVVNVQTDSGLNEARAFTETLLVVEAANPSQLKAESSLNGSDENSDLEEAESYLPAVEQILSQ